MAWELSVRMVGSAGAPRMLNYKLTGADYTAADLNRTAILTAIGDASEATIASHRMTEVIDVTVTLPVGVDVAIVGTLSGKISGTNKPVTMAFPAPAHRAGTTGDLYNELDLDPVSGAANLSYWNLFVPGGQATISDGESVSASGPRSSQIVSRASRMP